MLLWVTKNVLYDIKEMTPKPIASANWTVISSQGPKAIKYTRCLLTWWRQIPVLSDYSNLYTTVIRHMDLNKWWRSMTYPFT